MDTSDPEITFDQNGVCNHCNEFENEISLNWYPNKKGEKLLEAQLEKIRNEGKGKEFDCLIGLSGGVDSSYLTLKAKEWNLRPLVLHVDAGWNSELAVSNISKTIEFCQFDLYTEVVNWEEVRNLQLAYLRSGISNQDVPQDHIFFSSTYHYAAKNGIKYILSGGNIATESIFPKAWHGPAMDSINLKYISKKFGESKLRDYRTISFMQFYFLYPLICRIKTVRPLNFMVYEKTRAIKELQDKVGWRSYDLKHGESLFTKFFQNYFLPTRFGFDKRKPHFASLINSGQMTRKQALDELNKPLYNDHELERDIKYLCKKLGIEKKEFEQFLLCPILDYHQTPNWQVYYRIMKKIQSFVRLIVGKPISYYS